MKEIIQPEIRRPDRHDPYIQGIIPVIRQQWMLFVAPQLGIDPVRQSVGEALSRIIGDDSNCFVWTNGGFFEEPYISIQKTVLQMRLASEIYTPGMPENIRTRLREIQKNVLAKDWTTLNGFREAQAQWSDFRDWVEQEIEESPELSSIMQYKDSNWYKVNEHWEKFLYTNPES